MLKSTHCKVFFSAGVYTVILQGEDHNAAFYFRILLTFHCSMLDENWGRDRQVAGAEVVALSTAPCLVLRLV